jgi:hypothetical protein
LEQASDAAAATEVMMIASAADAAMLPDVSQVGTAFETFSDFNAA